MGAGRGIAMVPADLLPVPILLTCFGAANNFWVSGLEATGFIDQVFNKQGTIAIRATPYQDVATLPVGTRHDAPAETHVRVRVINTDRGGRER